MEKEDPNFKVKKRVKVKRKTQSFHCIDGLILDRCFFDTKREKIEKTIETFTS